MLDLRILTVDETGISLYSTLGHIVVVMGNIELEDNGWGMVRCEGRRTLFVSSLCSKSSCGRTRR
jgi:hypothetical protein